MDIIIYKGFPIEINLLEGNNIFKEAYTIVSETGLVYVAEITGISMIYGGSKEDVVYGARNSIDRYLDSKN